MSLYSTLPFSSESKFSAYFYYSLCDSMNLIALKTSQCDRNVPFRLYQELPLAPPTSPMPPFFFLVNFDLRFSDSLAVSFTSRLYLQVIFTLLHALFRFCFHCTCYAFASRVSRMLHLLSSRRHAGSLLGHAPCLSIYLNLIFTRWISIPD